jgi:mannose-6-phosphate isomerase-like protein (cupin superfamily)
MRCLVVSSDEQGQSHVSSSTPVVPRVGAQVVWECGPDEHARAVTRVPPDARRAANEPMQGGARWQFSHLDAPFEIPSHSTRTIDYKHIVTGSMLMELDTETVELRAGDLVVLMAARHCFRNSGEDSVDILTLLLKPVLEDEL